MEAPRGTPCGPCAGGRIALGRRHLRDDVVHRLATPPRDRQLDGDIYAARIVEEIERRTGRSTAPAAVYITLRRLEEKKLVESWMSDPKEARGGKSRRSVKVTKAGVEGLRAARDANDRMWKGLKVTASHIPRRSRG